MLKGGAGAVEASDATYPRADHSVRRGQRMRVDLISELPEPTIVHCHGLHVPDAMDGPPRFAIAPGQRYAYEFRVSNRAGRYWFHPHAHGQTGAQVYFGLAGLFLVGDDEEAALGLPGGRYDVLLVLQDRTFNDDNQFIYLESGLRDGAATDNPGRSPMMGARSDGRWHGWWDTGPRDDAGGMGSMMPRMMVVLGDEILVNGRSEASLRVERRPSRCDCSTAPIAQLQACLARWLAARRNRWVTV